MSDAASPIDAHAARTAPPKSWRMLFTTPLGELVRGRITGPVRIPPAVLAMLPPLPVNVQATIEDVVRRTRLWRSERAEITRELAAHFRDGLDTGASETELLAAFGDCAQAAALLRRAARRNRPWLWHMMVFARRSIAFVVVGCVAIYTLLAARYFLSKPGPIADLRPQLNAAAMTLSDDDKAWPLYRQALLAWPRSAPEDVINDHNLERMPQPGEEGWDRVELFLRDRAPQLELVREAAAKPGLGLLLGYAFSPEDAQALRMDPAEPIGDIMTDGGDGVFAVLLPHLALLRVVGNALGYDAQRAAAAGDAETTLANLRAMLGIVRQTRETPVLIADLVSLAIFSRTCETINRLLASDARIFSDADLTLLAHELASFDDAALKARLAGERLFFDDVLQRIYTDDGSGDGHLTPRGLRWLLMLTSGLRTPSSNGRSADDWTIGLGGPALSAVMLGRRDMAAEYDRLMDMTELEADVPLWERDTPQSERLIEELARSPIERYRRLPIAALLPALSKASVNAEMVMLRRDVTLTAIALEIHRRRHGSWPASLAELVPSILPSLPVDRFDGQPLRYVVRDGQPIVYSVGTDREDDGGVGPLIGSEGAQQWFPRDRTAQQMSTQKPIVTGDGRRILSMDGDWLLWPPPPQGPLKREHPEDSH